jgi:MFS family permease
MSLTYAMRSRLQQNPLILNLYIPSLLMETAWGLLIPILPIYARQLDAGYGLVGLVLAGDGIGMLLGDVPAGMLLRRIGKRAMLLGIVTQILAVTALFWVDSVALIVLLQILSGVGGALFNVSRFAYMAGVIPAGSRGRATALTGGMHRMGKFAGPAIGGAVAALAGLRTVFLVFAGFGLAGLALVVVFVPAAAVAPVMVRRAAKGHSYMVAMLRSEHRILVVAGMGFVCAMGIRIGSRVIVPLYADEVLSLDVGTIGLIVSLAAALDLILFYPAGLVMDRWGRKYAIVPSFVVQAAGMALLPLTGGVAGLLFAAGLVSFGNGLSSGSMMTLGSDLAPPDARGEFMGVWRLMGDIGIMGSPLLIGGVAGLLTIQAAGWVIAGVGLLAVWIFAYGVPETLDPAA